MKAPMMHVNWQLDAKDPAVAGQVGDYSWRSTSWIHANLAALKCNCQEVFVSRPESPSAVRGSSRLRSGEYACIALRAPRCPERRLRPIGGPAAMAGSWPPGQVPRFGHLSGAAAPLAVVARGRNPMSLGLFAPRTFWLTGFGTCARHCWLP